MTKNQNQNQNQNQKIKNEIATLRLLLQKQGKLSRSNENRLARLEYSIKPLWVKILKSLLFWIPAIIFCSIYWLDRLQALWNML